MKCARFDALDSIEHSTALFDDFDTNLTSIDGIEHEMCRSGPSPPSDSIASSSVIQFELSITLMALEPRIWVRLRGRLRFRGRLRR